MSYIELADGWKTPKLGDDESERLDALRNLQVLDTKAEKTFDRITETIAKNLKVPVSLVSLVDEDRQWFKSCYGIDVEQTSREQSFCAHAVATHELLHVPDATKDDRFRGNTLVTEQPNIRFYLGAPLIDKNGYALGSLCAIDVVPRHDITDEQLLLIQTMADLVVDQLELRVSNKRITEANLAKSTFFAGMSHEIRTPLNGIIGAASLIDRTELESKQARYVDAIIGSGKMLLEIINEILDFSKIENGSIELHETSSDLKKLVSNQLELLSSLTEEKEQICTLSYDDSIPNLVVLDETRIQQIISNLVSNAIKFTPSGGDIYVRIKLDGDNILFEVEDNGVGISPEQMNKIFVAYEQILEHRKHTKNAGTGLGLAISKYLVKLMHGHMGVDSEEGKGSKFWFKVPLIEACDDALKQHKDKEIETIAQHFDANVLLVEDVATNQFIITSMLESIGCHVDLAENGQVALDKVKDTNYDFVFMDCNMPVMDGYDATREIRNLDISQPKIIALTANAFKEDKEKCLNAGMDLFISKPVDVQKILETLNSA